MGLFSGSGVLPSLKGVSSNVYNLAPGQCQIISPAGWYMMTLSKYHVVQQLDPIAGIWRGLGSNGTGAEVQYFYSDGVNYRIINQSGCPVGALITNAGSGYVSAPVVTASAGGSIWRAIVGGALNTSVTVTNGGVGYTYPPVVQIQAPPAGGIQATGYCTLTAGVVTSVTIVDQGAGYASPPIITFVNDPREGVNGIPTGYNASAVAILTGAGTITGLLCLDHGVVGANGLSALPTLAFSGGGGSSAAATVIMNWTILSYAAGTAGAGLAGSVAQITAEDAFPTTAAAYVNPTTQSGLVVTRQANIKAPISGAGITAAGQIVYDGGCYTSSPTPLVIPTASIVTTAPVVTFTMGGLTGTTYLMQL